MWTLTQNQLIRPCGLIDVFPDRHKLISASRLIQLTFPQRYRKSTSFPQSLYFLGVAKDFWLRMNLRHQPHRPFGMFPRIGTLKVLSLKQH
jgi:hypothetical protein